MMRQRRSKSFLIIIALLLGVTASFILATKMNWQQEGLITPAQAAPVPSVSAKNNNQPTASTTTTSAQANAAPANSQAQQKLTPIEQQMLAQAQTKLKAAQAQAGVQANSGAAATPTPKSTTGQTQTTQQAVATQQQQIAQLKAKEEALTQAQQQRQTVEQQVSQRSALYRRAQQQEAFEKVLGQTLPMTPTQIERLKRMYNETQKASAAVPGVPPRPTSTSELVDLAPGAVPPVIRLSQGFVTSLVFIDSSGAPWDIDSYDLGNPNAFNIQWNKTGNTLMVQASSAYTYGNLAVKLKGLATPVMLTLIPGQHVVDYRVDLRVQGYGPNGTGKGKSSSDLPPSANPLLLGILDGVAPSGSKPVNVDGGDAQAWVYKGKLYVRTRMTVLSPSYDATMSSADGTHAYEMAKVPVILAARNGKAVQLKLEGL